MNPILHVLGVTDGSGRWYLWWSGIVGDAFLVAGGWALIRKVNCEQHRCYRIGRHDTAAGHTVCRKHHPDGHLTADDIHQAHIEAKGSG